MTRERFALTVPLCTVPSAGWISSQKKKNNRGLNIILFLNEEKAHCMKIMKQIFPKIHFSDKTISCISAKIQSVSS